MPSTKITGITANHTVLAKELGLTVTAEAKSFMVVEGRPAEILAQLAAGREAATTWSSSEGNLFGTLRRKLESGKGIKVTSTEDAPVETDEDAEAVMLENADNVVDGPWEYDAAEGTPADEAEETEAEDASDDEVPAEVAEAPKAEKPAKAKPEPKRAPLPEGYTTPVGLAKVITERGLYQGKREDGVLTSQSMYVYIKNNGEGSQHPFPLEVIDGRPCMKIEAGVQWWKEHQARVAAKAEAAAKRKAEAAEKAAQRAAKAEAAAK